VETSEARRVNRSTVLARLLGSGSCTRGELAVATGLSPAAVSRVVDALIAEGLIAEGLIAEGPVVASGRRGRNAASVRVSPGLGAVGARYLWAIHRRRPDLLTAMGRVFGDQAPEPTAPPPGAAAPRQA
jgi:MarR family